MNNDCIYYIFTKLPVKDIISCSQVSKQFNKISQTNLIWLQLFKKKFYNVASTSKDFYNNYKTYTILDEFLLKSKKVNVNNIIHRFNLNDKMSMEISGESIWNRLDLR